MSDRTRTPVEGPGDLSWLEDLSPSDYTERSEELVAEERALRRLVARWSAQASALASEVEHLLGEHGLSDETFAAVAALLGLAGLFAASEELARACQLETAP